MTITVSGSITHRCPFRDEVDDGTFELVYDWTGDYLIELYALREFVDGFRHELITHEELTERFAARYPMATVRTSWQTAGFVAKCESCSI